MALPANTGPHNTERVIRNLDCSSSAYHTGATIALGGAHIRSLPRRTFPSLALWRSGRG